MSSMCSEQRKVTETLCTCRGWAQGTRGQCDGVTAFWNLVFALKDFMYLFI